MRKFFVTGSSKGLGRAITELLLREPDVEVTGISRTNTLQNKHFIHIPLDLQDVEKLSKVVDGIFSDQVDFEELVLINNAGYLGDIKYLGDIDHQEFIKVMNVNVATPAILMNAFIRSFKDTDRKKVIINIGSGAGRHPYDGWGAYCSSKAAIDMLSEVGDMEAEIRQNGFRIVSLAPGPVETSMQEAVRLSGNYDFSQIQKFISLKESGQLPAAEEIAEKIVSFIDKIDQFDGPILDIRKMPLNL